MMLVNWVIISTIVCTEKCPTTQVAVIPVTSVEHIAVKVQRITFKQETNTQFLY